MDPLTSLIFSVLSSLVVAVISSVLAARLSLRSFYSEKMWERKSDVYSRLLKALCDKKLYLDEWFRRELAYVNEDKLNEWAKERIERFRELQKGADEEVERISLIGTFLISDEVADDIKRLKTALEVAITDYEKDQYVEDAMWTERKAFERCIDDVILPAKKDLTVNNWFRRTWDDLRHALG